MFIVIVIWISTFKISLKPAEEAEADFTPFKIFIDVAKDGYNVSIGSVKTVFDQIMKIKNE